MERICYLPCCPITLPSKPWRRGGGCSASTPCCNLAACPTNTCTTTTKRHRPLKPLDSNAKRAGGRPSTTSNSRSTPSLLQAPHPYKVWDAARRSREEGYLAEARTHGGEQRDESDLAGGAATNVLPCPLCVHCPGGRDRPADPQRAQLAGVARLVYRRGGRSGGCRQTPSSRFLAR